MRSLHRDVGFLVVGLTILFAVSGVVLVYRNTDTFTIEKQVNKVWEKQMDMDAVVDELPFRRVEGLDENGDTISFKQGYYVRSSGVVSYTYETYPWVIQKFISLHKSRSGNVLHWVATIYGLLLLFLAISSFWMFKPGTGNFQRGLIIAGLGIAAVVVMLFIL